LLSYRKFCSKLLLFGEYSIIRESNALAIPYPLFEGGLCFQVDNQNKEYSIDRELKSFAQYLKSNECARLRKILDVDSFSFDVSQGVYFHSSIPQGYGVGSSGALCASVFDYYSKNIDDEKSDIDFLKDVFSLMESYFHGSSSGIDPLISFLKSTILIEKGKKAQVINLKKPVEQNGELFLLNTGRARRTEPLVNLFLEKCKSSSFFNSFEKQLVPITNECIKYFLKGDFVHLERSFNSLSEFQYHNMKEMIPSLFRELWTKGLETDHFKLKLCGAGGGGFILGFTQNLELAKNYFNGLEVRPIRFNYLSDFPKSLSPTF